jgi:isopentenyl phosphate kinase
MEAREEAERARRALHLASAMTVEQLIVELQKHVANGHGKAGVIAGCLRDNGEFGFAPLKPGDVLFDGQCVEITSEDDSET